MLPARGIPRIKLCGITSRDDAEHAVAVGAWAIGLNFWPGSARRCDLDTAAEIAAALKRQVEIVGVFVNPTLAQVAATAEAVGLTMIQLHGDEGPAFCSEIARRTGCKVIKAARVRSGADIQALATFHVDYHLLDSHVPGQPGGTGETFAWELARAHRGRVPLILSGGLTPENVAEAIVAVAPFAVDVRLTLSPHRRGGRDPAYGVESRPGHKDHAKVEAFVEAVEAAVEADEGGSGVRAASIDESAGADSSGGATAPGAVIV